MLLKIVTWLVVFMVGMQWLDWINSWFFIKQHPYV